MYLLGLHKMKNKIQQYIKKHPEKSGYELYESVKGTSLGVRKQTFYEILRKVRKLPEPAPQRRLISVPRKYRKVVFRVKDRKEVRIRKPFEDEENFYFQTTLIDIRDGEEIYLRYGSEKDSLKELIKKREEIIRKIVTTQENKGYPTTLSDKIRKGLVFALEEHKMIERKKEREFKVSPYEK